MKDFHKRMLDEKEDLTDKILSLRTFIQDKGEVYKGLSYAEKVLLSKQLHFMESYFDILCVRIEMSELLGNG